MKKLLVPALIGVSAYAYANVKARLRDPLEVIDNIDLSRYAGKWYEIARLPHEHEADCDSNVIATYTLIDDETYKVVNECRKADGQIARIEGFAQKVDRNDSAAKLKVRFAPTWLWWLPLVWSDYWIIDLAPDYSYSMVGTADRKNLWLLCRDPILDKELYEQIVSRAEIKGFDCAKLVKTKYNT